MSSAKPPGTGAYLVGYNGTLFAAWAYILYVAINTCVIQKKSTTDLYREIEMPLMAAQTAALAEVCHCMVGIVRSPVGITAMQVASRLWLVWGIIIPAKEPTVTGSLVLFEMKDAGIKLELNLFTLVVAWALSEVVRYSFFMLKEMGSVPYSSMWLRYSAFIVLYPLGVASELTMVWLALPTIRDTGLWSYPMPNPINFSFNYYYVCLAICAVYIPGLPLLYSYMLKQRKKMLSVADILAAAIRNKTFQRDSDSVQTKAPGTVKAKRM